MGLLDIIGAVNATLPSGTGTFVGGEFVRADGAPPRVVWVPVSERFGPAKRVGDLPQRELRNRVVDCEVHVWGADIGATETLLSQVVQGLHGQLAGGFYQLQSGRWLEPEATLTRLGAGYVLAVEIVVPLIDAAATQVVVTTITQTTTEVLPSGALITQP